MLFKNITGLTDIKKVLVQSVYHNHVAHAQLFAGPEGSANLALALAYATFIQCENKQAEDACGQCASCLKMQKLVHPDLHFIFPVASTEKISKPNSSQLLKEWREFVLETPYADISKWIEALGIENKQPAISAEEARNITRTLSLTSFEGEYKIVLVWLPELMHPTASNAILKILEEPSEKTLFLLVSHQPDNLLNTIVSRLQALRIRGFSDLEMIEYLGQSYQLSTEKASEIAYLAEGNLQKALELLEEQTNDHHTLFRDWMRLCYSRQYIEMVRWSENFAKMTKDAQKGLLLYGLNMCRETLAWQYADQTVRLQGDNLQFIQGFSKTIGLPNGALLYDILNKAIYYLERNAQAKMVFVDVSLQISKIIRQKTLS